VKRFGLALATLLVLGATTTAAWAQSPAPPAQEAAKPAAAAPAASKIDKGDTAWMLTSSALVLMMTAPGLALFYGGMVRQKNALGTLMHSFIIMAVISIQWVLWGYSLAFGPDRGGLIGGLDWIGLRGVGGEPFDQPVVAVTFDAVGAGDTAVGGVVNIDFDDSDRPGPTHIVGRGSGVDERRDDGVGCEESHTALHFKNNRLGAPDDVLYRGGHGTRSDAAGEAAA